MTGFTHARARVCTYVLTHVFHWSVSLPYGMWIWNKSYSYENVVVYNNQ